MADAPGPTISLRPGGGRRNNPFTAFSLGAGVKAAVPQKVLSTSATPHTAILEERKKELGLDFLKYSKQFMLHFAERCTRVPPGLEAVKGLVVDDVTSSTIGTGSTAKATEPETDNWRSSVAPGGAAADGGGGAAGPQRSGASAAARAAAASSGNPVGPPPPESSIIQKAEDIGRKKWSPAKDLTSTAQAQQKLRGLLNKLTPDNFDRLTTRVLEIMSVSSEVLRSCIPLLFEKAVAEPTFCALYADLSSILSHELAAHNFGSENGKPVAFKRELLNTCQDEFEGMQQQRESVAAAGGSAAEEEYARRKLKMRQLGTLRLIAELFNRDLLTQPVMRIVMMDMLKRCRTEGGGYDVALIECLVQAVTIAGEKMSKSDKIAKSLDQVVKTLGQWSNDSRLEARIRFKIKDLQDQISAGWRAKHENTVMKTEEIRKQAHTELGIVQPQVPDFLPALNLGSAMPKAEARVQENLFPGVELYGMPVPANMETDDVRPDAADTAKDTSGVPKGSLPDDDVRKKAHGTFQEFLSIRDLREAEDCMRELSLSEAQEAIVVATALNDAYDLQKEDERSSLRTIIVHLADVGCLSPPAIQAGIREHTDMLEDLAVDIPLAPQILGRFMAALFEAGGLQVRALEVFFEGAEGAAAAKRSVFKYAMKALAESLGQAAATEMIAAGDVHVGPLLDGDKELEPGLPSVFDFVKLEGLDWVPL